MRELALAIALVACGKQDAAPKQRDEAKPAPAAAEQEPQKLDDLAMALPQNWTAHYEPDHDRWLIGAPLADGAAAGRATSVRIDRADPWSVASPEAFLHHRLKSWPPGTTAEIQTRAGVKDGFAMTVVVKPAAGAEPTHRETYVVRQ